MQIDEEGTVDATSLVTSPISGTRCVAVVVEALRDGNVVATTILGDLLRMRTSHGDIDLVVGRVTFSFTTLFGPPGPLPDPMPAELVPLLRHRPDGLRERCIRRGDRFRVRATVERQGSDTASFLVRDERGRPLLDEALSSRIS